MVIFDWLRWRFFLLRYEFRVVRLADKRFSVVCRDLRKNEEYNVSGRILSKKSAEELCGELKQFKTFRDSKTDAGRDFSNPQVKSWLRRQRKKEL